MRINKWLAGAAGISRRSADNAIAGGKVTVNGRPAVIGQPVKADDKVLFNGHAVTYQTATITVMLNKPTGYVCSRAGQGSKTVYELLPKDFSRLNPIGRLDKDSSGLLLLTNDGALANLLTHPRYQKIKEYKILLTKALNPEDELKISHLSVLLADGLSKFKLDKLGSDGWEWKITMKEGRNRQIRRTFSALGYSVANLHRVKFGDFTLGNLKTGVYKIIKEE